MTTIESRGASANTPLMLPIAAGGGLLAVVVLSGGLNPLVLLCVLAMLPISLMWLWAYRRAPVALTSGLYGLDGLAARWALVLSLPALGGLLMAMRVQGLDLSPLLAGLALGLVLCASVLALVRANPLTQPLGALFVLVVSMAFGYGVLSGLDVTLDRSAPRLEPARVIDLNAFATSRGGRYVVHLASASGSREYPVSPLTYGRLRLDGPACILHRQGALGFAWLDVSDCGG